ncbi:hypothetical protein CRUP_011486 [Coryphaenoides rupestris]|nr:hypothetical protein CRUP_011486 [Coryphaenoides rupestris]
MDHGGGKTESRLQDVDDCSPRWWWEVGCPLQVRACPACAVPAPTVGPLGSTRVFSGPLNPGLSSSSLPVVGGAKADTLPGGTQVLLESGANVTGSGASALATALSSAPRLGSLMKDSPHWFWKISPKAF